MMMVVMVLRRVRRFFVIEFVRMLRRRRVGSFRHMVMPVIIAGIVRRALLFFFEHRRHVGLMRNMAAVIADVMLMPAVMARRAMGCMGVMRRMVKKLTDGVMESAMIRIAVLGLRVFVTPAGGVMPFVRAVRVMIARR